MTVAEIKEKICNTMVRFEDLANRNKKVSPNEVNLLLGKICSMLDELEQEKNMYKELEDKIVRGESIPLMANEKFIEMLEKDTELEENNK